MSIPRVAVVILNYNNKAFLSKFLPGVIQHSVGHEVCIADNGSSDDSISFVTQNYPHVRIIRNNGNYGYAQGYNLALANVAAEFCILLNSDVEVTTGWIDPILELFTANNDIGAIQPKLLDFNNRDTFEYAGAAGGFIDKLGYPFCRGRVFNALEKDVSQYDSPAEIFWATGACLAVRMDAFKMAGGFDERFFAHMEEIDLCWRLRNLGYKIFAQPRSVVFHVGGGTLNKVSPQKTYLNFRNNLSTLLKNDQSSGLTRKIMIRLVLDGIAGIKFLVQGSPLHCWAVVKAHMTFYTWIPSLLQERKKMKTKSGFIHSSDLIYRKSIVAEYFIRGRKRFSDLDADVFS